MSKTDTPKREDFRDIIAREFESHTKSLQFHDSPDCPDRTENPQRHYDGEAIYRAFGTAPFWKYLHKAARLNHDVDMWPQALSHFVTHIREWEKYELGRDDPDFSDVYTQRRRVLEWFAGFDKDDPEEREEAASRRQKRLRPGGTGIILHGEQGTTKTTAMYWLASIIIQTNRVENIVWQSTLDDTEWQVFAPWATLCLPEGVEIQFTANPYSRDFRDLDAFEIDERDVCRRVIRYSDPEDLISQFAEDRAGHVYVVYPDPRFRQCQALTTWEYQSMWDVDSSDEATDINHFWFALMEALVHNTEYNDWTTLVADEAHKWLRQGKGNDEHDWWNKIDDWATYWGDARKKRLSCILAIHKWHEIHNKVRDKVRWGATMNGEEFPPAAPRSGQNVWDQDLGDMCVWGSTDWNFVGYPDIKSEFDIPGDIEAEYPTFEAEKRRKS